MNGRRIEAPTEDTFKAVGIGKLREGDYFKDEAGVWWVCVPNGNPVAPVPLNDGITGHPQWSVTEHEDGTITVSPSIRQSSGENDTWHGYLERGFWRAC